MLCAPIFLFHQFSFVSQHIQTSAVTVYRLLTIGSVEIDMMEKQISKKKLERMAISGGNFSKPGQRREGTDFTVETLKKLLTDDVNLLERADSSINDKVSWTLLLLLFFFLVHSIVVLRVSFPVQLLGIGDEELYNILDRKALFTEPCPIPSEGEMYDIIALNDGGGILGQLE
jgi:hypothetical protein